jgi:hypothetical protein
MGNAATQPGVPSLLRVLNDRSTLELLLTGGVITRAAVGRRTAPVHPTVVISGVGDSAVLHGATLRAVGAARQSLLAGLDDLADAADG